MSAKDQSIISKFSKGKPVFSVEFFPPKNEEGARQIIRTANKLKPYNPDFVSITYGAGGSTRERTLDYAELLTEIFGYTVMSHLTCVGHSRAELREVIGRLHAYGIRNIMALRGDPPKGETSFTAHSEGLKYASELVTFIKMMHPEFCLGVAGYPEKHPEAVSLETDMKHLKNKVSQGADFITTQLFFDNAKYFSFVEKCRAADIQVPILPGLMPVVSTSQIERFCQMCGTAIPAEFMDRLKTAGEDSEAVLNVGVEWSFRQIRELLEKGAPGYHLYILNRSPSMLALMEKLRKI